MNKRLSTVSAVVIMVVGVILCGVNFYKQQSINRQVKHNLVVFQQKKKTLAADKRSLKKQQTIAKLKSNNPTVQANAKQTAAQQQLNQVSHKFFKTVMTFDNLQTWQKRSRLVAPYVSADVLSNKNLFNSGKDNTGNDIFKASHIHSKFGSATVTSSQLNDDGSITGNVLVTFDNWTGDNDPGVITDVYTVKYDTKQKKLTSVQRVANLEVTSSDN
ncbi:hypothetical protein [uncultured Limosilactobacillus sp.]|uniref:hypothetical protein n=1 Tax=uncultured Limosilactobacillus sp. TaxID=2837629 RepID=UPI0025DB881F|nr:hypothetical protein [uncultured Limosilactobacillus sp.]